MQVPPLGPADKAPALVAVEVPALPVGVEVEPAHTEAQWPHRLAEDALEPLDRPQGACAVEELGPRLHAKSRQGPARRHAHLPVAVAQAEAVLAPTVRLQRELRAPDAKGDSGPDGLSSATALAEPVEQLLGDGGTARQVEGIDTRGQLDQPLGRRWPGLYSHTCEYKSQLCYSQGYECGGWPILVPGADQYSAGLIVTPGIWNSSGCTPVIWRKRDTLRQIVEGCMPKRSRPSKPP